MDTSVRDFFPTGDLGEDSAAVRRQSGGEKTGRIGEATALRERSAKAQNAAKAQRELNHMA